MNAKSLPEAPDKGAKQSERIAYSPKEFGGLFGRSATWAYRLLYAGTIKAVRISGCMMIPAEEAHRITAEAEEVSFSSGGGR